MKRYVNNVTNQQFLQPVEAMAIINPDLCRNLTIQVEVEQRDEGPIPHMHVYHNKERNPKECSYIRLDAAEYSTHHKDNVPLPRSLKKQFIRVMIEPCGDDMVVRPTGPRYLTGYEEAVRTWVNTFEGKGNYSKFNVDEDGELVPPDYTQL